MSDINPDESIADALEHTNFPVFVSHASSLAELEQRVEQIAADMVEKEEKSRALEEESRALAEETRERIKQIEQQLQEMMQIIQSGGGIIT